MNEERCKMYNIIKNELIKEIYKQGRKDKVQDFDKFTEEYIRNAEEVQEMTGEHLEISDWVANFDNEDYMLY